MALAMISRFRGSPFAFPLAALAALVILFISETSYQHASRALDDLGAMGAARQSILELRRAVTDAETGERGYLLTHRREYLEPYNRALAEVSKELSKLNAYYAKNAAAEPVVRQVTQVVDEKLSEMRITLDLYDQGKERAWQDLLLSNIGKEKMDVLRSVSDELERMEAKAIETHRKGVYQTLLLSRIGVATMTALLLVSLYFYLRQAAILTRQREALQRATQAERDDLEVVVARRTAQLTELAQHLQTIREDERNRLARELHDELGSLLTAAKLDLARLKSRLGALTTITPELGERLNHLGDSLNDGIALKRRIIEDLRPSSLDNLGLTAALDILLDEFRGRAEIEVVRRLEHVRLSPAGQLTVYRLVQEALTNIVKYARATKVEVTLEMRASRAMISVRDNGVGFDPNKPSSGSHGLLGMRYRIEAQGGRMHLTTAPGKGTLIEATLPESAPQPATAPGTQAAQEAAALEGAALSGTVVSR